MNFSRRNFVKLGGIAALASLGFSGLAFGKEQNDILFQQTSESLRQWIGTEFYFTSDNTSTAATLTNIKDFPKKTPGGESFSMEFQVPLKQINEDNYRIWHTELGNFELYCTNGKNGRNRTLLATINRI